MRREEEERGKEGRGKELRERKGGGKEEGRRKEGGREKGGWEEEGRRKEGGREKGGWEGKGVGGGVGIKRGEGCRGGEERKECNTHIFLCFNSLQSCDCHLTSLLPSDWLQSRSLQLPSSFSSSWYFCVTARKLL